MTFNHLASKRSQQHHQHSHPPLHGFWAGVMIEAFGIDVKSLGRGDFGNYNQLLPGFRGKGGGKGLGGLIAARLDSRASPPPGGKDIVHYCFS